ncbi:hypothetical protein [Thalassospira sp. MBR-102]|uniref:virion core protein, T7 gp14 family n=1 Tax=Thalassospira sp. MBR-102 TaxID=3156466 RepID=UPI003390FAC3
MTAAQMFAASLATTALSTAASLASSMYQSKQQASYQQKMAARNNAFREANAKAVNEDYIEQAATKNIQLGQAQEASSQELQAIQRERRRAEGTAVASSNGAGVSFDMLMRDFNAEEARYRDSVRQQLDWDFDQGQREIAGMRSQAESAINSVQPYTPQPINTPSLLGAGAQFAGGALSAFGTYARYDPDKGNYSF